MTNNETFEKKKTGNLSQLVDNQKINENSESKDLKNNIGKTNNNDSIKSNKVDDLLILRKEIADLKEKLEASKNDSYNKDFELQQKSKQLKNLEVIKSEHISKLKTLEESLGVYKTKEIDKLFSKKYGEWQGNEKYINDFKQIVINDPQNPYKGDLEETLSKGSNYLIKSINRFKGVFFPEDKADPTATPLTSFSSAQTTNSTNQNDNQPTSGQSLSGLVASGNIIKPRTND